MREPCGKLGLSMVCWGGESWYLPWTLSCLARAGCDLPGTRRLGPVLTRHADTYVRDRQGSMVLSSSTRAEVVLAYRQTLLFSSEFIT